MVNDKREDIIRNVSKTIREWFSKLPVSTAAMYEDYKPGYEYIYKIEIKPSNTNSSSISIGIRIDYTFDINLGKDTSFNEILFSKDVLLEICEAVFKGNFIEQIWEWKGRIFKSKSTLKFSHEIQWEWLSPKNVIEKMTSDQWVSNRQNILGLFGLGRKQFIKYQPWG